MQGLQVVPSDGDCSSDVKILLKGWLKALLPRKRVLFVAVVGHALFEVSDDSRLTRLAKGARDESAECKSAMASSEFSLHSGMCLAGPGRL